MEKLEIEVKFYLKDTQSLREYLSNLGAQSRGRFFERNLRYEDIQNTLASKKLLLRLRQDKIVTLTFKSPAAGCESQFKKMNELEVEVSDFDNMHQILKYVGFHCEQVYEKWRETFALGHTRFCMDEMPFGNFLEIEGQEEDIRHCVSRLGLQWKNRILLNYLEIFNMIQKDMNLNFRDVTFDNFNNIVVSMADYLDVLIADK